MKAAHPAPSPPARRARGRGGTRAACGNRRAPRNRPAYAQAPAAGGPSGASGRCRPGARPSAPAAACSSPFSLLERAILAGDELDAPPDARRCFAVAGIGGALLLHAEPREQWPPPPLRGRNVDRRADAGGIDAAALKGDAGSHEPGQWVVAHTMAPAAGEVVGVGELLGTSTIAQRFEARAIVELQARRAHAAAHELGTCDQIGAAGARELAAGGLELGLRGGGIAGEVVPLERLQSGGGIRLPL